ncbi:MAG: response regulator, partial [Acidobacteria bacterium]|nr:response regulator [Acidobacteriota bacterium]
MSHAGHAWLVRSSAIELSLIPHEAFPDRAGTPPPRRSGMTRTPRVLVVEDEHDIAALVKHTLERSGDAQVQTVASGDVALRVAMEEPPDLIILDLNLPVLSGSEVCRILRARTETARIPIIML